MEQYEYRSSEVRPDCRGGTSNGQNVEREAAGKDDHDEGKEEEAEIEEEENERRRTMRIGDERGRGDD